MKIFVLVFCISIQILSISSKILPKHFPAFCSKSEPNYSKCMEKGFSRMGPYFLKGIRSIDFPSMHPLIISTFSIDRQLTEDIYAKSELKNLQFYGYDNLQLRKFEFNPTSLNGRVVLYIPVLDFKFEYDASGTLGNLSLANAGYLAGNATGLDLEFNFKLKTINKIGIDYLAIDKFEAKGEIQDAFINPVSRDPNQQATCDFIAFVFNENPKQILQLANVLYNECLAAYYGSLVERFLSAVPANEIIPE